MTHCKTAGDSWHTHKEEGRYFSLKDWSLSPSPFYPSSLSLVVFLHLPPSSLLIFLFPCSSSHTSVLIPYTSLLPSLISLSSSPTLPFFPLSYLCPHPLLFPPPLSHISVLIPYSSLLPSLIPLSSSPTIPFSHLSIPSSFLPQVLEIQHVYVLNFENLN